MSFTVGKLIKIAQAEIGYKEKETNSQLDSKTANAGDEDYTRYARDLYKAGYYNGNKNGYAWCDVFVDWCFYQLCGKDSKKAQDIICQTGPLGAGCTFSAQYYKNAKRYYTTNPKVGDQVFFGDFEHTGIVETVNGNSFTTIEGNASNQVKRCTHRVGDGYTVGFGRPKYDVEVVEEPVQKPEKTETTANTTYTVQKGDAMWRIAEKYGVSTSALIEANPQIANPSLIYVGQKINIPSTAKTPSKPKTYTVQKGDSMWAIAEKLGVDYQALVNANPQIENKSLIYAGQKINIPS